MIKRKNPYFKEENKIQKLNNYLFKKRKIKLYILNTIRLYHFPIIYLFKKIKLKYLL